MSTLTDFTVYYEDGVVVLNSDIFDNIQVTKTINRQSDRFSATTFNTAGSRASLFTVGNQVRIYHDTGSPPTNQVFYGSLEFIEYDSKSNDERLRIGGRDYTSTLMDTQVNALYTSGTNNVCEVGSIVRDLIWTSEYSGLISVGNVSGTNIILPSFRVRNASLFNALNDLGNFANYNFWVDYSKSLHFEPMGNTSTGYVLDSGNCVVASVEQNRQAMANRITVYGGRQLVKQQETFTGDGAGSIFTLTYGPHDPFVTVSGVVKQGNIFEQTNFLPTGAQYLVDFDTRRIIFISGTSVGVNIPGSLVSVVVQYSRSVPIVKEAQDDSSIAVYGLKEGVVINPEIKDPRQAQEVASSQLILQGDPPVDARIKIHSDSISGVQPGQLITVNLPNDNILANQYTVFQTTYDITQENLLQDSVIGVRVGNRIKDTSDILQDIINKQRQLESVDVDPTDVITKLRTAPGSFGLRAHWKVWTVTDLGSSYVVGYVGDAARSLAVVGSPSSAYGALVQAYVGDSRAGSSLVESGGDWSF